MIAIWFLLLLFAGVAAGVALVIFAIARNRPGFAVVVAVAAGALVMGLLFVGWFAARSHSGAQSPATLLAEVPTNDATSTVIHHIQDFKAPEPPEFTTARSSTTQLSWRMDIKLLVFLGVIAFLLALVIRRLFSPASCGHRRIWPVFAVIPLIVVFFFFGTLRYESSQRNRAASESQHHHAQEMVARQQAIHAHQRADMGARTKKLQSQAKTLVGRSDIHTEMDKFDAPRIPLTPEPKKPNVPPAPPEAPPPPDKVAAAADQPEKETTDATTSDSKQTIVSDDTSESKSASGDTTKALAEQNRNRKKSDKPSDKTRRRAAPIAAQSTPAEVPSDNQKESAQNEKEISASEPDPSASASVRPAWTKESPRRTGNTYREVIETDPYESADECYQAADIYLLLKAYQRIQDLAGRPYAERTLPSLSFQKNGIVTANGFVISYARGDFWVEPRLQALTQMSIRPEYLRREIVAKSSPQEAREFLETVEHSFGPMKKLYLQIEFTPNVDRELMRNWDSYQRRERFAMVGVGAGSILGLVGLAFALLKVDTLTKGYYTKRLFIGVPLAMLALFGLYAMLAEMGFDLPH